jgi:hypothetical protein
LLQKLRRLQSLHKPYQRRTCPLYQHRRRFHDGTLRAVLKIQSCILWRHACCFNTLLDCFAQGVSCDYFRGVTSNAALWSSLSDFTTEQVCQIFIKPRTARSRGSWAQELLADVNTSRHINTAVWFISHCWEYTFTDTLEAVMLFLDERRNLDEPPPFLWLDFMATSQHIAPVVKDSKWWMQTFQGSIARIGGLLLVVDKWHDPKPLKRAWYCCPVLMSANSQ